MSPHAHQAPYRWEMRDPAALAHRFSVPDALPPYTALTIAPHQAGLFFINGQIEMHREPDLYLLTGSRVHSLEEADRILHACGEATLTYNSLLTLFDLRPKLYPARLLEAAAASGEVVAAHLSLVYQVADPQTLDGCGATYQPCEGGSEIRQDDPRLSDAFRRSLDDLTALLARRAAQAPTAAEAEKLLLSPDLSGEMRPMADAHLLPVGLQAVSIRLSPARALCPHCRKPLSLDEMRRRFCSSVDEAGRPQPGCNRRLHACPGCGALVGPEQQTCADCGEELLFCFTPWCETYRRVERGRFCPVCRRACYPLPDRELLPLA